MKRQPPRGKPSLAPAVDLLQSLEQLTKILAKCSASKSALAVVAAVLHDTSQSVSCLINKGAPTRAMIHIVQMNEDVSRTITALTDLGAESTAVLEAAGKARLSDIHELAKFLEAGGGGGEHKKKSKFFTDRVEVPPLPTLPKATLKGLAEGICASESSLHPKTSICRGWTGSRKGD